MYRATALIVSLTVLLIAEYCWANPLPEANNPAELSAQTSSSQRSNMESSEKFKNFLESVRDYYTFHGRSR
jgi:hypothetical protein